MDRLTDLKQCSDIYYNSNPSFLIEDTFALLHLITKAARIIQEFDEIQIFSSHKDKIDIENINKELEYWNNISTFFKDRVSEKPHLPIMSCDSSYFFYFCKIIIKKRDLWN